MLESLLDDMKQSTRLRQLRGREVGNLRGSYRRKNQGQRRGCLGGGVRIKAHSSVDGAAGNLLRRASAWRVQRRGHAAVARRSSSGRVRLAEGCVSWRTKRV